jgi:Ca-activated chloride channel homolog
MTFEPVLPPLFLAVIAVILLALRAVALRGATVTGRHAVLRWSTTTVAILLVLLAAARPVTGSAADSEPAQRTQAGAANVYFVVDRSADSAITDFGGAARMSGIRADIAALIDTHPGARFAVISFASRPAIDWPLSSDSWSLVPVVEALNPYPGPTAAGTEVNAAAAANVLRYQLIAAGQQYPQAPNLVYYLGSGAAESTVPQGVFDTGDIDGGAVLGYGGGGPGDGTLRGIADQLGLPYVQRSAGDALPELGSTADQPVAAADPTSTPRRVELYWALTMLAALLLLGEIHLTTRDLLRARATRKAVLP